MRRLLHRPTAIPGGFWMLFGCVAGSGAVKVSVVADRIQVVQGGSAFLPCSFRSTAPLSHLNIIWTVTPSSEPSHPQQVLAFEQGKVVESVSHYAGRASFAFSPTESASIILNDTHGSDSGTYQCSVMNPPDAATPNIGVVRLTVFVPPSSPRCSSEGDREEGGSLQFSCAVDEGMPVPTFTWEKIPPDTQPLVMSYEGNRHTFLTLHNLTATASGLYRCTASNMLGFLSCALELRVHVPPRETSSLMVSITFMLSMGLVLLTLFALAFWLHHHSMDMWTDGDDSRNKSRTDSFSLGRLIVAKSPLREPPMGSPVTKPLWIFTSSTPNTTYAHRKWRPQPGNMSQAGLRQVTPARQGQWRSSSSLSERQGSWSGSEEKHPGPGIFPKPTGFLV